MSDAEKLKVALEKLDQFAESLKANIWPSDPTHKEFNSAKDLLHWYNTSRKDL